MREWVGEDKAEREREGERERGRGGTRPAPYRLAVIPSQPAREGGGPRSARGEGEGAILLVNSEYCYIHRLVRGCGVAREKRSAPPNSEYCCTNSEYCCE